MFRESPSLGGKISIYSGTVKHLTKKSSAFKLSDTTENVWMRNRASFVEADA